MGIYFSIMVEPVPSVSIPSFPFYCDLVVFPSPYKENEESSFFLIKMTSDVPSEVTGHFVVEHIPGSIYCLLPSSEESKGRVSVHPSRPSFLDNYSYCLEINKKSMAFHNQKSGNADEPVGISEKDAEERNYKPCYGCFVSHFPSPNTVLCKWNKKRMKKEPSINPWPVRLRGGANNQQAMEIVEKAIVNAKAHGINLHAGVQNLANGNCAFESIIDSMNTRDSLRNHLMEHQTIGETYG